ncbi:putative forkhead-associated (FHA) domain, SMAD/FHA domain superfamily [Plasmopara halstedii]
MPFLRSLKNDRSYKLCSSKTLIGSEDSTCDFVISDDNVLELHALLYISIGKASAKLIPLSTAQTGVCYVNDVIVREDGAVIVHGDRLSFGDANNAFVFEITPHSEETANPQQLLEKKKSKQFLADQTRDNHTLQKAVNALRRDRNLPNISAGTLIQSNLQRAPKQNCSSKVTFADPSSLLEEQLSRYLLEASTDSLLNEYVERKLSQRKNGHSLIENIDQSGSLGVRQSRQMQNIAELDKLQLIRDVNDVLNGDIQFQDSYLLPPATSERDNPPQTFETFSVSHNDDDVATDDNEKDEEDDALPDMMEKASSDMITMQKPMKLPASVQTEPSNKDLREQENDRLDHSFESVVDSEISRLKHHLDSPGRSYNTPVARNFTSKAIELGVNDMTRPINTDRQEAVKIALRETNAGEITRHMTNEYMDNFIVRWKRGLLIQSQNRQRRARQIAQAGATFERLHRDQSFNRWRALAFLNSQVMSCRMGAFQLRSQRRLLRMCWLAFCRFYFSTRLRSILLRGLAKRKVMVKKYGAFQVWRYFAQNCLTRDQLHEIQCSIQKRLDVYLMRMSELYCSKQTVQPMLAQILRKWRNEARCHEKQLRTLRKVLLHTFATQVRHAWTRWTRYALTLKLITNEKRKTEEYIQQISDRLTFQHDQLLSTLRERSAHQFQKLTLAIARKDRELEVLKRQQVAEDLQEPKWEHDLRKFLENAIIKVSTFSCDEQIRRASDRLEILLQSADNDVYSARFGASQASQSAVGIVIFSYSFVMSQILVNCTIQQKADNANERIRLHEALSSYLIHSKHSAEIVALDLSPNCRFLYDMIQQVIAFIMFRSFPLYHNAFLGLSAPQTSSAASSLISETCCDLRFDRRLS